MEMKKINSGELRAIGYDDSLQHSAVSEDLWRRLSSSGAAWSFYRDNIEEEFAVKKVSGCASAGKNPLEELFGQE
jgi:hypothetical protein